MKKISLFKITILVAVFALIGGVCYLIPNTCAATLQEDPPPETQAPPAAAAPQVAPTPPQAAVAPVSLPEPFAAPAAIEAQQVASPANAAPEVNGNVPIPQQGEQGLPDNVVVEGNVVAPPSQ